jgi:hypothetical protein
MADSFDHLISLGSDCDVSLHLRRTGRLQTPSVFDWLVTPWDAMMGVLCDHGERLATDIHTVNDGNAAACGAYGLLYWHEFKRNAHWQVEITPHAIAQTRQKLLHKMARLRALCASNRRVLFIRAGIGTDAPGDRFGNGAVFRVREMDRCAQIIAGLYPALQFCLLVIDYKGRDCLDGASAHDPRVLRYTLNLPPETPASGRQHASNADWDAMLSLIPYEPDVTHVPDEEYLPS